MSFIFFTLLFGLRNYGRDKIYDDCYSLFYDFFINALPPKITGPERFDLLDFCEVCECFDLLSSLERSRDGYLD
jgi:hypothetical protein